jgi:hypothetical protein
MTDTAPALKPGDKVYMVGPRRRVAGGPEHQPEWQILVETVKSASAKQIALVDYLPGLPHKIFPPNALGRLFHRTPSEANEAFRDLRASAHRGAQAADRVPRARPRVVRRRPHVPRGSMKIWRCPKCGTGIRAPSRLRHNDARRFCLSCSAKAVDHLLVERVCPSRDAARARGDAQRKVRKVRANDRAAARRSEHAESERGQLEEIARRWCNLAAWGGKLVSGTKIEIRLSQERRLTKDVIERTRASVAPETFATWLAQWSPVRARPTMSTGHAYSWQRRMVVTAGSDRADALTTIIHELAHLAAPARESHGDRWRTLFVDAVREVSGYQPTLNNRTYHDLHSACAACIQAWITYGHAATPAAPDVMLAMFAVRAQELRGAECHRVSADVEPPQLPSQVTRSP